MSRTSTVALFIASIMMGAACKSEKPLDEQQKHIQEVVAAGGVVDSILPIAVHLERFRKPLGTAPDTLRYASTDVESLARRWATAVATSDTMALNQMVMNRAEFAWFYYPESKMSKPPYEAPPELLWGQLLAASDEGAQAALRKLGGSDLAFRSIRCPGAAVVEGSNRLHEGCLLTLAFKGVTQPEAVYFGTIIERDKRFKFVGLTNHM